MADNPVSVIKSRLIPFGAGNNLPIEIKCRGKIKHETIEISFALTGSLENISFDTPEKDPKRTDNLWQRTCFELFVKNVNSPKYWEYNLSPSLNWAIYGFENYRGGKFDELSITSLPIITRFQPEQFLLESVLPLPEPLFNENLKIGLSCVVQDKNGDIYYYALKHIQQQADFHDADSFDIEIRR